MREVYCINGPDLVFWTGIIALGMICLVGLRFVLFLEDFKAAAHKRAYWAILESDPRKRHENNEGHRAPKN